MRRFILLTALFYSLFSYADTLWNISDAAYNSLGTVTSTKTINGLRIYATSDKPVVVDASSHTHDGFNFTHRLKLQGNAGSNYRAVSFWADGNSTIEIYVKSGNSDVTRTMRVDEGSIGGTLIGRASVTNPSNNNTIKKTFKYNGSGGYIYVYGEDGGINLYAIKVVSSFWNISYASFNSLGTITSTKTIDGLRIYATSEKPVVVDESAHTHDGIEFTHRLKLQGNAGSNYRAVSFWADGNSTIEIYVKSGNSDVTRTMRVDEGSIGGTMIGRASVTNPSNNNTIKKTFKYNGSGGYIYVYGEDGGINLYAIRVSPNESSQPQTISCAQAAQIAAGLAHNTPTSETYTVVGYVTETDGNVSRGQQLFWMADTKDGGQVFESYWGNVSEAMQVGDYVSLTGKIMRYNSTYEIKNGNVVLISRESATKSYTVTVSSANTTMGTVSGGGTYEEGKSATVTASPETGYKFTKWSDNTTKNPYTFTVTKDVTLVAYFEKEETSEPVDITGQFVVLAQRDEESDWFYMTSDLGTANKKRYQAVDAGTSVLSEVVTGNLDSKYYWEIEGDKLKTSAGYSTWVSENTATLDDTGIPLTIRKETDGTYTISFMDNDKYRYLALNKEVGLDYFAFYHASSLVVKQLVLLPKNNSTAINNILSIQPEYPQKLIRDGQLLIFREGKMYNVQGQEMR